LPGEPFFLFPLDPFNSAADQLRSPPPIFENNPTKYFFRLDSPPFVFGELFFFPHHQKTSELFSFDPWSPRSIVGLFCLREIAELSPPHPHSVRSLFSLTGASSRFSYEWPFLLTIGWPLSTRFPSCYALLSFLSSSLCKRFLRSQTPSPPPIAIPVSYTYQSSSSRSPRYISGPHRGKMFSCACFTSLPFS